MKPTHFELIQKNSDIKEESSENSEDNLSKLNI